MLRGGGILCSGNTHLLSLLVPVSVRIRLAGKKWQMHPAHQVFRRFSTSPVSQVEIRAMVPNPDSWLQHWAKLMECSSVSSIGPYMP